MKCTIFTYEASSSSRICYFDRHLEGGLLHLQHIFLNDSKNCQMTRGTSSRLWSQLHSEQHASAPVLCVGDSRIRILSSVPIRRYSELLGPATVPAMGYPIHESYCRRSLTRYILHESVVIEEVLVWHDIISFSTCRLYRLPTIVGRKCVLRSVGRLCATLYNTLRDCQSPSTDVTPTFHLHSLCYNIDLNTLFPSIFVLSNCFPSIPLESFMNLLLFPQRPCQPIFPFLHVVILRESGDLNKCNSLVCKALS